MRNPATATVMSVGPGSAALGDGVVVIGVGVRPAASRDATVCRALSSSSASFAREFAAAISARSSALRFRRRSIAAVFSWANCCL